MTDLIQRAQNARETFRNIIDRICGTCENSCCHQGTMMGTYDALRLVKGMALEPGREQIVRDGLQQRAEQLQANLQALHRVRELMTMSPDAGTLDDDHRKQLEHAMAQWKDFIEFLRTPWPPEEKSIRRMLQFSGTRAIALRILGRLDGAHSALANLFDDSSFQLRREQVAPPRCLFHSLSEGCLAGRWKPGKCANFFCTGQPNVLEKLRENLAFDEFVLANSEVMSPVRIIQFIRGELEFGPRFVEPKVLIGLPDQYTQTICEQLNDKYSRVDRSDARAPRFMLSVTEWRQRLDAIEEDEAVLINCDALHGSTLYELAVALDEYRAKAAPIPLVIVANEFRESPDTPHPLWTNAQMSQPLGVVDILIAK